MGVGGGVDKVKLVEQQFEKSAMKLHCMLCGDTMFFVDSGQYICIGCNLQQEIMIRFSGNASLFAELLDCAPIEEIRATFQCVGDDTDLLNEIVKIFNSARNAETADD